MNVFLYAVIPGFILVWWYGAIKALTQRAPETIGDFVFLFVVFIVMPVGYGYFLWKRKQPNRARQANLEALVNDLCDFARSDNYIYAYVDLSRDPYACSSLCFKTADGNSANYYFNILGNYFLWRANHPGQERISENNEPEPPKRLKEI